MAVTKLADKMLKEYKKTLNKNDNSYLRRYGLPALGVIGSIGLVGTGLAYRNGKFFRKTTKDIEILQRNGKNLAKEYADIGKDIENVKKDLNDLFTNNKENINVVFKNKSSQASNMDRIINLVNSKSTY